MLCCAGCAASGPEPGSLKYIMQQQRIELAHACYETLTSNPWKKTYYNVGGVLVDERNYCDIWAHQLVDGTPGARRSSVSLQPADLD